MESRSFRLVHPDDTRRVIRGRVDGPRGFAETRAPLPHVILLHGFKGFMDWGFFPETARRIAARGMVAIRFNVSGSGIGEDLATFSDPEAFARNTVSREMEDLETVRAWIRSRASRGIDPGRVALLGHSRGGGIALVHAAERGDCSSVVAWAAVSTFDRFDEETKRSWRERGHLVIHNARTGEDLRLDVGALEDVEKNRSRLDIPAACRRLRIPVLLAHGTADETVSPAAVEEISAALDPGRRRTLLVDGAGHTFGIRHPMLDATDAWEEVVRASLDFIEKGWARTPP